MFPISTTSAPIPKSHVGKLDIALDHAAAKGWIIVDMKKDWKSVDMKKDWKSVFPDKQC